VEAVIRRAPELMRLGAVCLRIAEKLELLPESIGEEEIREFYEDVYSCDIGGSAGRYSWKDAILYATYIEPYIEMLQYGHVAGLKMLGERIVEAVEDVWKELDDEYRAELSELVSMIINMLTYVKSRLEEEKTNIEARLEYTNSLIQRLNKLARRKSLR